MKDYISIKPLTNIQELVNQALELKKNPYAHKHLGENKTLGLLFLNPSLRTRLSTQKAAKNLGMEVLIMNAASDGWKLEFEDGVVMNQDQQEHFKEAAGVLGRYCDILGIRSFPLFKNREQDYAESVIKDFKKYSKRPIVNLESGTEHPLQGLADILTIQEHKKTAKPKVVLTWAPHPRTLPQSVPNSFASFCLEAGYDLTITHPKGLELAPEFTVGATIEYDQEKAIENADFVYAKNWAGYNDYGVPVHNQDQWMVTQAKLDKGNNAKFMHCLPVRRNVIVEDAVLDGPSNLTLEQAENRIYAAQVVLKNILENL